MVGFDLSGSKDVRSQINIAENQALSIDFTAGRGPNGITATLEIRQAVPATKPKTVTRSAAVETTPEVEEEDDAPEAPEEDEDEPEAPEASADEADADVSSDEDTAPVELAAASSAPRVSIFSSANK